jgi:hypothetical protein
MEKNMKKILATITIEYDFDDETIKTELQGLQNCRLDIIGEVVHRHLQGIVEALENDTDAKLGALYQRKYNRKGGSDV